VVSEFGQPRSFRELDPAAHLSPPLPRRGGDGFADGGVGAGLQALVDEHAVIAFAGGEDRSTKSEAVAYAFDSDLAARSPDLRDVEGDADSNPVETRGYALERGFEGLRDKLGLGLHGSSAGKDTTAGMGKQKLEIRNWGKRILRRGVWRCGYQT